jgi:hypothetical protein
LLLHSQKLILVNTKTRLSNLKPTIRYIILLIYIILELDALLSYFIPRITLTPCHNAYSFLKKGHLIFDHQICLVEDLLLLGK